MKQRWTNKVIKKNLHSVLVARVNSKLYERCFEKKKILKILANYAMNKKMHILVYTDSVLPPWCFLALNRSESFTAQIWLHKLSIEYFLLYEEISVIFKYNHLQVERHMDYWNPNKRINWTQLMRCGYLYCMALSVTSVTIICDTDHTFDQLLQIKTDEFCTCVMWIMHSNITNCKNK